MKTQLIIFLIAFLTLASCNNNGKKSDAYGNFEAIETIIASESAGKAIQVLFEEGQLVKSGDIIAITDTTQLYLNKLQLATQKDAIKTKLSIFNAQIDIHQEQLKSLRTEKERLKKLVADGAATTQKMDEIDGQENVLLKQIEAVKMQKNAVYKELDVIDVQLT